MTTKGPQKNKGKQVKRLLAIQMLILALVVGICLVSAPAYAVSVGLSGTRTVISGSDCALATYRFGTNTTYSGQALDLLVEVIQEDNEQAGSFQCVGVDSGVLFVSLRDKDSGENIAYADLRLTLVAQGSTTPVTVDRMVVTGFDLDRSSDNTQTDTDDMYFTTGPTTRSSCVPPLRAGTAGGPCCNDQEHGGPPPIVADEGACREGYRPNRSCPCDGQGFSRRPLLPYKSRYRRPVADAS